jgi:GntR family carbon starvation induced transcriptional regulator
MGSTPNGEDVSASDNLLDRLRGDIRSLVLPPCMKLNTQMLESRYNAGLSPIREALSTLTGEGLVTREDRRGFRVSAMSLPDFDELTRARAAIEIELLRLAFDRQDPNWHIDLVSAVDKLGPNVKAGDERPLDREWERNHRAFHFALIDAHHAALLLQFCERIYDRYDRYRLLALPTRAYLASVGEDHREMADAVWRQEHQRAIDLLGRHIIETSSTIRSGILMREVCGPDGEIVIGADNSAA